MGKIHTIKEIETNLSKERHDFILELSEYVNNVLVSSSNSSAIKKYNVVIKANNLLINDLEKDIFASNIAFPDEEIFAAILRMNNINFVDILNLNIFEADKKNNRIILNKISSFREKYYQDTTINELLNKLNQMMVYSPNLLKFEKEANKSLKM